MKKSGIRRTGKIIFGFEDFAGKLFDTVILNVLWLLSCVPIITVGAATTAFYYTAKKVLVDDEGYVFRVFLSAFKLNFKKATQLWLIWIAVIVVIHLDIAVATFFSTEPFGPVLKMLYVVLLLFAVSVAFCSFTVQARFDMKIGWILKLSMYMFVRYFLTSLLILLFVFSLYLCYLYATWLLLVLPSYFVKLISPFLEKKFRNYM